MKARIPVAPGTANMMLFLSLGVAMAYYLVSSSTGFGEFQCSFTGFCNHYLSFNTTLLAGVNPGSYLSVKAEVQSLQSAY